MRASLWGVTLAAALCLGGTARAQNYLPFGTSSAPGVNSLSDPSLTGSYSTRNMIGTPFRLRDLFHRINPFSNSNPVSFSEVPDPTQPGYLNGFGFRRVRTPY
jgi:hypothetical protein